MPLLLCYDQPMIRSRTASCGCLRRDDDNPVRSVGSVLLERRMSFEDADLCDLFGREGWHLITLESHSIYNEKERNLSRVRRDRGCKGAACGLR